MKKIVKLPADRLIPHPADPFQPYKYHKMMELMTSIKQFGLLDPILTTVENSDGFYTILSGKNRVNACKSCGYTEIDAIVYDVDDDTALMIMTDDNLRHRDSLLPSERGHAYRIQLEATKKQREMQEIRDSEDKTPVGQIDQKWNSRKIVAGHYAVSEDDVKRYIRLTFLIPELLALVDNETMPFISGVDLSLLDEASQRLVYEKVIIEGQTHIDLKKSTYIKKLYKKIGTFGPDSCNGVVFQSRGETGHIYPLINRKMFNSLINSHMLPDDDAKVIEKFMAFLRDVYKASGSINVKYKVTEVFE